METQKNYTSADLIAKYGNTALAPEKFSYMMFFLGQNIIFGVMMAGINTFWQSVLAMPLTTIGMITLIARVWDAVNDPLLGIAVQKRERGKNGRFKPWAFMTAFVLPIVVMLSFVNLNPHVNDVEGTTAGLPVVLYAFVAYIMYGMAYTLCDVPAFAMAYTMEADTKKRTQLVVWGRIGAGIAGLFTSFIFWGIIGMLGGPEGAAAGSQAFFWSAFVLMLVSMGTMSLIWICKERNEVESSQEVNSESIWTFVSRNRHLMKILIFKTIISFTTAFVYATVTVIILSGILGNGESGSLITITFTVMSISGFALSLIMGPLIKKFGKRRTTIYLALTGITIVLLSVVALVMTWDPNAITNSTDFNGNPVEIIGAYKFWPFLLFQLGAIFIMNTSISMGFTFTPDAVEYATYRTGIRQEAIGQSVSTFCTKLDMGIAGMFSAFVLAAIGVSEGAGMLFNQGAADAARTALFVSIISILLGGIVIIVCWGVLWTLNREDVSIIAGLNREGKTDDLMDIKLGIHRSADTQKDLAIEGYKRAKLEFDINDESKVEAYRDSELKLRGAKAHFKASYANLRHLTAEHKKRLKKEAKAERKQAKADKKAGK